VDGSEFVTTPERNGTTLRVRWQRFVRWWRTGPTMHIDGYYDDGGR
jgi:hypothetical protein